MSVRDLFIQAPHLCGANNHGKHSEIAKIVWDQEQRENKFPRIAGESAAQRVDFLFDWECIDYSNREYCASLAELSVLAHYGNEHDDKASRKMAEELAMALLLKEPLYPDVAEILTVEQSARGNWF